ncbi:MAG: hypothetical protein U9Q21_01105 [Candidatus Auribacterota bacterium]|nr:hypothetical protein [Candidatus Auribacterota bacterium]
MKIYTTALLFLMMLSGCTIHNPFNPTTAQKVDKAKFAKLRVETEIEQRTKQFVTGTKEILESKEIKSDQEQISLDFIEQAERLLGGEPIEKIDVEILLELYDSDKEKYERIVREKNKIVTVLKKNELNNETTISALEQQLEGEKARSSLWQRIRRTFRNYMLLMILAVILLLIFAPHILAWIISKIPSLVSLFGITSFRIVKNLVKGVQEVRTKLAELPDDKKLDKVEILDLISRGLKEESDDETTNTVKTIRKKYNLESITKKLKNKP